MEEKHKKRLVKKRKRNITLYTKYQKNGRKRFYKRGNKTITVDLSLVKDSYLEEIEKGKKILKHFGLYKMNKEVSIRFGPLSEPILKQIKHQGFNLPGGDLYDKIKEAIILLYFQNYITESIKNKLQKKLFNSIIKEIKGIVKKR